MAEGYAGGTAYVVASGIGSLAAGFAYADGSNVTASGDGSFAGGWATGYNVVASGQGSFAFGAAGAGTAGTHVICSANSAFQFGEGTNALAETVQVGSAGLRLHMIAKAAPAAPQNGDIWIDAAGYVNIRSNGVNCKCVNAAM
jgi:hypothetical protein